MRPRRRPPGRAALVGLLLAALLAGAAGCGRARESSPAPDDTASPPGGASAVPVAILTGTAAGGEVDLNPVPLDTPVAVAAFVGQFDNRRFAARIERRVARTDVGEGRTLVGSVVSIGCQVPTELAVLGPPGRMEVTPVMPESPTPVECFAPMTSVGLVDMSDALLADGSVG